MHRFGFLALALFIAYWPSQVAAQSSAREKIRTLALEMAEHARTRQDDKLVDLMYPKVVELMGGHEKTKAIIQKMVNDMAASGYKMGLSDVGQPSELVEAGGKLFALVPEVSHVFGPGVRLDQDSYLLAISLDQGKTWTFLDGAGITPEKIRYLFPDFPPTLKLPERKEPRAVPVS